MPINRDRCLYCKKMVPEEHLTFYTTNKPVKFCNYDCKNAWMNGK